MFKNLYLLSVFLSLSVKFDKLSFSQQLVFNAASDDLIDLLDFSAEQGVFLGKCLVLVTVDLLHDLITVAACLWNVQGVTVELEGGKTALKLLGELLLLEHHVAIVRVVSIVKTQV